MIIILKNLKSLFQANSVSSKEEARIDGTLQRGFRNPRERDPETKQQWLRLQQAIVRQPVKAVPQAFRLKPLLARGMAGVATAISIYLLVTVLQPSPEIYATRKGEQKEVILSDGSRVTLHYASELTVLEMQQGKPRRLALDGEAYFRVERNETPFTVSTDNADVTVVGTEFNLRKRNGNLEVAVLRGGVNVTVVRNGVDSTVHLTRDQRVLCSENKFPGTIGSIPSSEYPGWMHGKFYLDKTSFAEACREIEMRFDVSIQVRDRALRSNIITGILDAKTAESAVTALCELTGKRFSHDGQKYILY